MITDSPVQPFELISIAQHFALQMGTQLNAIGEAHIHTFLMVSEFALHPDGIDPIIAAQVVATALMFSTMENKYKEATP